MKRAFLPSGDACLSTCPNSDRRDGAPRHCIPEVADEISSIVRTAVELELVRAHTPDGR